jgi:hypothetical protein
MRNIEQMIRKHDNGKEYPSRVTRAARRFIVSDDVKCYGWGDEEFVNGFQQVKTVKVIVTMNNRIQTIWHFDTIQERFGKIGYRVHSWCDQIDVQISKEDGNTAYLMIMQMVERVDGAKVIVERF